MAIKRFKAEAGWWDDLTPEEQTKYISEHPDSKLAKNAKAREKKDSESDTPSEPSSKKTTVKKVVKKVADKTVDTVKKSGNLVKKAHKVVHEWDVKETEHMKHFMRGNDHEPGSTVRRSWGEALRSKATGFVKHMMQDTKEHIHALNALANMPIEKGAWKKISDHDRKSLKILGINLGIFATSLAATGGLGGILHAAAHHGAGAAIQHLAIDYVKEIVITSASRAAVFAAEEKVAKSDKELLEKFYNGFAEYMENGDIDWEKAFSKADGSEAEEKRELPMDRVVSRLQETSTLIVTSRKLLALARLTELAGPEYTYISTFLKGKGYRLLGKGAEGSAWTDGKIVLKVMRWPEASAYMTFAQYVREHPNKHYPKILAINPDVTLKTPKGTIHLASVKVERLKPLPHAVETENAVSDIYHVARQMWLYGKTPIGYEQLYTQHKSFIESIVKLRDICTKHPKLKFDDINCVANTMLRGSEFVNIDPFYVLKTMVQASKEYRYAMVNRPAGLGTCPKDFVGIEDRPAKGKDHYDYARNGVVVYNRELTDQETKQYELAPMLEGKDRDDVAKSVAKDMAEYAEDYLQEAEDDFLSFVRDMSSRVKDVSRGYPPSLGDWGDFAKLVVKNLKKEV